MACPKWAVTCNALGLPFWQLSMFLMFLFPQVLCSTLWPHHTNKLFIALVNLPTSVRFPQVTLLVSLAFSYLSLVFIFIGYSGSLVAFHISVSLICAAIYVTDSIFWLSKRVFVLFLSEAEDS